MLDTPITLKPVAFLKGWLILIGLWMSTVLFSAPIPFWLQAFGTLLTLLYLGTFWPKITLTHSHSVLQIGCDDGQPYIRTRYQKLPVHITPHSINWARFILLECKALTQRKKYYCWVTPKSVGSQEFKRLSRALTVKALQ